MARRSTLKGKRILITGAASGIGRLLASELYLKEQTELLLLDINYKGLEELRVELMKQNPEGLITIHDADISSAEALTHFVEGLAGASLDILINNAGTVSVGAFENRPFSEIEKVLNVNLVGTMRLTHLLLPTLLKAETPSIVIMASVAGYVASPALSEYSASKFGLIGFTDALRTELHGRVHVCSIAPAFLRTGLAKNAINEDVAAKDKMDEFLQKFGDDPMTVARKTIKAIKKKRKRVLVNFQAYLLYYSHKWTPWLTDRVVVVLFRMLKKRGYVN